MYLNPGNGDFSSVTPTEIGSGGSGSSTDEGHSTSVAVEDVNRDGVVDLVIGNDGTSNMIYLGSSASPGDFSSVVGLPFGSTNGPTTDVEVGDIDGDGAVDIAAANDGTPNVIYWGDPSLAAGASPQYAGLGVDQPLAGTSGTAPWPWSTIGGRSDGSTSIALGDLDNDGDLDIVVGNAGGAASQVYQNQFAGGTSDAVRNGLKDSSGTDLPGSAGDDTMDVAISGGAAPSGGGLPQDINLDGWPDIVLAVDGGHNQIYYGSPPSNAGSLVVTTPVQIGVPNTNGQSDPLANDPIKGSQSVDLMDVDGDGDTEVVFGNADGTTTTYYNDAGTMKLVSNKSPPPPSPPPPSFPPAVPIASPQAPPPPPSPSTAATAAVTARITATFRGASFRRHRRSHSLRARRLQIQLRRPHTLRSTRTSWQTHHRPITSIPGGCRESCRVCRQRARTEQGWRALAFSLRRLRQREEGMTGATAPRWSWASLPVVRSMQRLD